MSTCKINYVNIQGKLFQNARLIMSTYKMNCVNMQVNYVNIQDKLCPHT